MYTIEFDNYCCLITKTSDGSLEIRMINGFLLFDGYECYVLSPERLVLSDTSNTMTLHQALRWATNVQSGEW